MAATATQVGRLMAMSTPLGGDVLMASAFDGVEAVSELFHYSVDCLSKIDTDIPFDKLLGQGTSVRLFAPGGQQVVLRHFHGLCRAVIQGESDVEYTRYRLELVPQVWLLTKKTQSRIFQQISVPEILKKVLQGFDFEQKLQGKYEPRDYCAQYRETDWNFACRLMEEEGIFYYFTHADNGHKLILCDHNQLPDVPGPTSATYKNVNQGPAQDEELIYEWGKSQELTSGKVTLWDHCFEKPKDNYQSQQTIAESLQFGQANHKLKVANNDKMELYDYPGEFAQRFDGIDPGGGRRGDVDKIPNDGKRTANLRMQAEASDAVIGRGGSTIRHLTPGHKFVLTTMGQDKLTAPAKAAGSYIVKSVTHVATMQDAYRTGGTEGFTYHNSFTAVPAGGNLRPPRAATKPVVPGSQTATVVGPAGQEIFTDPYGRIKVQFHWDREGKHDANSSCWVRVGTPWAGRGWGMMSIPRIGQEVIVDFLEGDPDQPIVVGSVWNAGQMPAYPLPDEKTKSYVKSNSTLGGKGFNEFRFEDKKGEEQIFIHGERNQDIRIKNDCMEHIMHDRHLKVGDTKEGNKVGNQYEEVMVDKNVKVHRNFEEHIGGNKKQMIGGVDGPGNLDIEIKNDKKEHVIGNSDIIVDKNQRTTVNQKVSTTMNSDLTTKIGGKEDKEVAGNQTTKIGGSMDTEVGGSSNLKVGGAVNADVGGDQVEKIGGSHSTEVGGDDDLKVGGKQAIEAGNEVHIKAGTKVIIEAGSQVSIIGPGGFIDIGPGGVTIQGTMVKINSGGSAGSGSGVSTKSPKAPGSPASPDSAQKAEQAKPTAPAPADQANTGDKSNDDDLTEAGFSKHGPFRSWPKDWNKSDGKSSEDEADDGRIFPK